MNMVVTKEDFNINNLVKKSKQFMNVKYEKGRIPFFNINQPHYKYNDKAIMIEEYLDNIYELKILMINGKIINIFKKNIYSNTLSYMYDSNFIKTDTKYYGKNVSEDIDIKLNKTQINTLKRFCNDFYNKEKIDFVRLDFFIQGETIYFGEFTFTPDACVGKCTNNYMVKMYEKYIR